MSYGRVAIYTDATEINAENVADEVRRAYDAHLTNLGDINRLWDYYRGKTAILSKKKEIRPEINHKVNENRAFEITNFYEGWVFGEPIQYVRRENPESGGGDDTIASDINALNGYMADASKASCDMELAKWLFVCGTSYRLTLPNPAWDAGGDESPFLLYALDPRNTFIVRRNDVGKRPIMAVYYVAKEDRDIVFSVYTENAYYEFSHMHGDVRAEPHALGAIPIVEYPADIAKLGVFEPVLPLLDALDELQSNRMDDIVQFVNSFLAVIGAQLDKDTYASLEEYKTLCLPEGTDAKYLSPQMNQSDVQTLKDDIYQSILTICGVPNRNGGSSTSDTGSAVIMRDGWQSAEADAKSIEQNFRKSEKETLKLVLRILRDTTGTSLRLTDIETRFTRRNYENITAKAEVLVSTLNSGKVHPELCFSMCGAFPDPESAYLMSKEYMEKQQNAATADTLPDVQPAVDGSGRESADTLPEVQSDG